MSSDQQHQQQRRNMTAKEQHNQQYNVHTQSGEDVAIRDMPAGETLPITAAATATPAHPLGEGDARQLGEWLTADVARITKWDEVIPKGKLHGVSTGQLALLGKLFYDACIQFNATGKFPVDVKQYGDRVAGVRGKGQVYGHADGAETAETTREVAP